MEYFKGSWQKFGSWVSLNFDLMYGKLFFFSFFLNFSQGLQMGFFLLGRFFRKKTHTPKWQLWGWDLHWWVQNFELIKKVAEFFFLFGVFKIDTKKNNPPFGDDKWKFDWIKKSIHCHCQSLRQNKNQRNIMKLLKGSKRQQFLFKQCTSQTERNETVHILYFLNY